MPVRRLLEHSHDDIADDVEELEERLEDIEREAANPDLGALVPNHDHNELSRSLESLRESIARLEDETRRATSAPFEALAPFEERLSAIERRHQEQIEAELNPAVEAAGDVVEEPLEIAEEVVVPKRPHWYEKLPRWF